MSRYRALVWSMARSALNNSSDAEDAMQEIFLELWKSAARFDARAGSEIVFVRTIARRKLIDRLRAQGRQPATLEFDETSLDPIHPDRDDDAPVQIETAAVSHALELLGATQREILLMGVVQGMTHSEIARATGKPLGTIKAQLRRGLAKLRTFIERGAE